MKEQKKIIKSNKAWNLMKNAIIILREVYKNDKVIKYYVWKLSKVNDKLQSIIFKKLQTEIIDEEFKKIIGKIK